MSTDAKAPRYDTICGICGEEHYIAKHYNHNFVGRKADAKAGVGAQKFYDYEWKPKPVGDYSGRKYWLIFAEDYAKSREKHVADLMEALERILGELPFKRDWLDPELERRAREALRRFKEGR